MQRLSRSYGQQLTPAQRAINSPVILSSARATVVSVSKAGLYQTSLGIDRVKLTVERSEELGQPLELWAQVSLAGPMSKLKVGDVISFSGSVQGSIGRARRPHVVVNSFELL